MSTPLPWIRTLCIVIALISAPLARSGEEGRPRDVTPDIAAMGTFGASEAIALLGRDSVLVTSGRAGMHRSENRGEGWSRAMRGFVDPTGVEPLTTGLCQSPSAPATVYGIGVGASSGGSLFADRLYRTRDFGETWEPLAPLADMRSWDCAVDHHDPAVVYWLGAGPEGNAKLYKSTDAGATFAAVGTGLVGSAGWGNVRVAPTDQRTLYVAVGPSGLFKSTDGGLGFQLLSPTLVGVALHPTRDGTLYSGTGSGPVRSTDGGVTFTPVPGLPAEAGCCTFDPEDPRHLFAATAFQGLYESRNGGASFSWLPGPAATQLGRSGLGAFAVGPARHGRSTLYVGTGLGPHRSDDGGKTFTAIHRGYRGAAVNDLGLDASGRLLVAEMHTVLLYRGQRPGNPGDYDVIGAGIPGQNPSALAVAASPVDPGTLVLVVGEAASAQVYWTDDGGMSWHPSTGSPGAALGTLGVRMAFAPSDHRRVYLALRGSTAPGLYRSDDAGRTFRQTSVLPLSTVAVHPAEADVIYASRLTGASGLFKSTDGGSTFARLIDGNFSAIAIDPADPLQVYAGAAGGGGVLRSGDAGVTWASASEGLPPGDVLDVRLDPWRHGRVYAWVREGGLFRSDDGADTWRAVETDEAQRRSGAIAGRATMVVDPAHRGRLYLGNSGVLQIDTER